tara:strand:+ start:7807 stop:8304 length:498 start_codon:yes stop_codon:yes gene_type:complete
MNSYSIASGASGNMFNGDLVKLVAGGGIQVAAAGARVVGVFAGCEYTDASGDVIFSNYWPSATVATNAIGYVYDDPMTTFGVQSDGSTVAADVGNLGDHVATAGSTSTGNSSFQLNGSTGTAYAGMRVLGKIDSPDNDWGTNVLLEVQIYEHEYGSSLEATTPGV